MKSVLAALLLFFQLQPALGAVACLGLTERAGQQECRMPEQGRAPAAPTAASHAPTQPCELATICTPAPLAIPGLSSSLEIAVRLDEGLGALAATLPFGISQAPPFHPPRA